MTGWISLRRKLLGSAFLGNRLRLCYGRLLRARGDGKIYFRAKFHLLLIPLAKFVRRHQLIGGYLTANGEYFLMTPDRLLLYYNFSNPELTRGDGQSLEFLSAYQDSRLEKFILETAATGSVYIDVGANSGYYYALKVARASPQAAVFAFEPDPRILYHLKKNVEINQLSNVTIVPLALVDAPGFATMTADLGASNFVVPTAAPSVDQPVTSVSCDTLDNFIASRRLSGVSLIKADIEGGEHAFLLGGREQIQRQRPILLLELDDALLRRSGSSVAAVLSLLAEWQYRCFRVKGSRDALAFPRDKIDRLPMDRDDWLTEVAAISEGKAD